LTSAGRTAWVWLHALADRLDRVRIVHGEWSRCLNNHYGGVNTAVFLDPPYREYEELYSSGGSVADAVADWARQHDDIRIALCGHIGDYDLSGWKCEPWKRRGLTYGGDKTTGKEAIWFSPACLDRRQGSLFT
jgi:hypothetical protein